jgi:carbonic anhydrase
MRKHVVLLIILAGAFALASSSARSQQFSYEGNTDPRNWGNLNSGWQSCNDGTNQQQSPINLSAGPGPVKWGDTIPRLGTKTNPPSWQPSYNAMPLRLERDQHTVDVKASGNNTLTVDGTSYNLIQFHFHHPSEHRYENRAYDMELHMVHTTPSGQTAVLGIFISADRDTDNPILEPIFSKLLLLQIGPPEREFFNATINPNDLVKDFRDKVFIYYQGSKTTPPCTPNVRWIVLGGAISISPRQLATYKRTFPRANARPFGRVQTGSMGYGICCQMTQFQLQRCFAPGGAEVQCP